VRTIEFLAAAIATVKEGSDPRIQLELALLKATQPQADLSLQALMFRIEQLERRLGAAEPEAHEGAGSNGPQASAPTEAGAAAQEQPSAARPAGSTAQAAPATAAVAEAAPEPQAETSVAPDIDLERVQTLWPAVAEAVRERNAMVGALLLDARPTALEGDRLTVCFPDDAAFSKKKAEANRELVGETLRGLTGNSLAVVYELGGAPAPDVETLSEEDLIARLREEFAAEEVFEDEDEA
jgi:DNA polymerase III subunit gamma/tau